MSNVWFQHALRKVIKAAADAGIPMTFNSERAEAPEPRFMISMDYHSESDIWLRLPRWMTRLYLWKLMRNKPTGKRTGEQ